IEVHPYVRTVDALEDVPADNGIERRAIVIFEHEADGRIVSREASQVAGDGGEGRGREIPTRKTPEEQAQHAYAKRATNVDLSCDRCEGPIDVRRLRVEVTPSAGDDRDSDSTLRGGFGDRRDGDSNLDDVMQIQVDVLQAETAEHFKRRQ